MNLADKLAVKRTELAFERTLLSFVRTGIMFLSAGIAIIQIRALKEIYYLGLGLIFISPIVLIYGVIQFKKSKTFITTIIKDMEE